MNFLNFNNFSTAPPRIRLEPQRQVVRPGDQVDIRCEASGDQPITINWFKMDGVLPPAVLVNNGQLQVLNNKFLNFYLYSLIIFFSLKFLQFRGIAVSDAGRYVCSARNSVGQAEAVAEVIVNGKSPHFFNLLKKKLNRINH